MTLVLAVGLIGSRPSLGASLVLSNPDWSTSTVSPLFTNDIYSAFFVTTGGGHSWDLNSLTFLVFKARSPTGLNAWLYDTDGAGLPGSALTSLTATAPLAVGLNTFTADTAQILDPSTTYAIVFKGVDNWPTAYGIKSAASTNLATSSYGWSSSRKLYASITGIDGWFSGGTFDLLLNITADPIVATVPEPEIGLLPLLLGATLLGAGRLRRKRGATELGAEREVAVT